MLPSSPILLLHICSAVVGLIAGAMSMAFRKGSSLHRLTGNVFFGSMLSMAGAGVFMATVMKFNRGNIMGGTLMLYMVSTGWVAAKRREQKVGLFDYIALLGIAAIGTVGVTWGLRASNSATGSLDRYPSTLFFVFGSIAL